MKVLIVEDQGRLGEFLKQALTECRYTAAWVRTCKAASDALAETPFDVVILDLGLPDGDGIDLLRQWRKSGFNEPVLILSARDSVADRIKGLDVGADDYLPKPFSFEELIARLRSLLRRQSSAKQTLLEHRGIELDLLKWCRERNMPVMAYSPIEQGDLLENLARSFASLWYPILTAADLPLDWPAQYVTHGQNHPTTVCSRRHHKNAQPTTGTTESELEDGDGVSEDSDGLSEDDADVSPYR